MCQACAGGGNSAAATWSEEGHFDFTTKRPQSSAAASAFSRVPRWYLLDQGYLPKPRQTVSKEYKGYC